MEWEVLLVPAGEAALWRPLGFGNGLSWVLLGGSCFGKASGSTGLLVACSTSCLVQVRASPG